MRKILSLLMFLALIIGVSLPPIAEAHAGSAASLPAVSTVMNESHHPSPMKCCEKSKVDMDHRHGSCAADCHYLPVFLPGYVKPDMVFIHSVIASGQTRQEIYFPMRPPIAI